MGCTDSQLPDPIERILPDPGEYIYGAIASDEPNATIAARNVLLKGGTAADAAVAAYFTLAITAPSLASLGAGGVCLVHNPISGKVEALDFIAPASVNAAGSARPTAIPTGVRGMAALHGRYGRLPWSKLLQPAEELARSGQSVTRRLANDLERMAGRIFVDDRARRLFANEAGAPLRIGEPVRQIALGSVIAQVRGRGAGAFYTGTLAARIVEGVRLAGGTLTLAELREYLPQWRPAVSAYFGRDQIHVAGPPAMTGLVAAQMWQMLATDSRYAKANAAERPHLLAETARRAFGQRARWTNGTDDPTAFASQHLSTARARELLSDYDPGAATAGGAAAAADATPDGPAGTGFTIVDGTGMAVTCTVTLYDLFGIGRVAPGTGIFPARAPGSGARGPASLGPVMVTRPADRTFRFAVAGAAGHANPTAAINVAAKVMLEKTPLPKAMAGARIHADQGAMQVFVEPGETDMRVQALSSRGHAVLRGGALGRLNAVSCPAGVPADAVKRSNCSAATDSRDGGLSRVFLFERE
jgi:gamma-glutamyltranspeptidase/glutathione hydrolase